jgi:hypothetical protein
MFWTYCGETLLAYGVESDWPVRKLENMPPSLLIPARNGLWRVSGDRLMALAGEAHGRAWSLRHLDSVGWKTAGRYAWALDDRDAGAILVRLDLETGGEREFPIETGDLFPVDLEPIGDEVWITGDERAALLRFRPEASPRPVDEIVLADDAKDVLSIQMTAGRDGLWVVLLSESDAKLYKIPAS